jgi:dTDP-4-dehydrorhamnose 3,5-epimerase
MLPMEAAVSELRDEDIIASHRGSVKSYRPGETIEGVETFALQRFVDDRGSFIEIFRREATHSTTEGLARFFAGVDVAQMNWAVVDSTNTIKGLHYHLKQTDLWFCPPQGKMKVVLWDLRTASATADTTLTMVLGDGRGTWLKIPPGVAHGYRPLVAPCPLLYIVTRPFDLDDPDEYRIPWDHPKVLPLWDVENG